MQTTYGDRAAFFAGEQTKASNVDVVDTAYCDADISFGVGLARVLNGGQGEVEIPTATGFTFGGVAVHSHAYANQHLAGTLGVESGDPINLKSMGYAGVRVDDDLVASLAAGGSRAVYLRHTDGAGTNVAGNFRNDADTDEADLIPGARFTGRVVGTGAGALAEIFFNTP
jgi:hypothetical protein